MVTSAIQDSSATLRRRWQWTVPSIPSLSPSNSQQDNKKAHHKRSTSPISETVESPRLVSASEESHSLLTLPIEIVVHHLLPQLDYPSLLALRLSHPRFYHSPLLYPSRDAAVRLRVLWLVDCVNRAGGVLPWAGNQYGGVDLRTDQTFLAHEKVREMVRGDWNKGRGSYLWCGPVAIWYPQSNLFTRERMREALQTVRRIFFGAALALIVISLAVATIFSTIGSFTTSWFRD